jgi:hypothetical protein
MRGQMRVSSAGKLTVAALVAATVGVLIQMVSGVPYPAVPPVFFIQLIPAGLIALGRWRWAPVTAILAGVFLIFGVFVSGAANRMVDLGQAGGAGGSVGLWVQMVAVAVATVSGIVATIEGYGGRAPATLSSERGA